LAASPVCAIRHTVDPRKEAKDADRITHVIPIAGNLLEHGGKAFDWSAERLSTSDVPGDAQKEGVRLTLKGGMYEREQRAVIELLCDKERTGLEGEWEPKDKPAPDGPKEEKLRRLAGRGEGDKLARIDDVGFPEKQLKKDDAALVWDSYGHTEDKNIDVLRLTWHTKYACEEGAERTDSSNHWGFFTWIVIL